MRTTVELDDQLHEQLLWRARRDGVSLAKLLGNLVEDALHSESSDLALAQRSRRFKVLVPAKSEARAARRTVQEAIDEEGIL